MKRVLYIITAPVWMPITAVVMGVYYFGVVTPILVAGIVQQCLTDQTRILDWMENNLP